jgi:hypothetical protein
MATGDHIIVPLSIVPLFARYTHHGIDIGDGTVVHWSSGLPGEINCENMETRKAATRIRRTPIEEFGDLNQLEVREYDWCFDEDTVVERALSRVGEDGYDLFNNNCEHLATWCKTGDHRSEQVDNTG